MKNNLPVYREIGQDIRELLRPKVSSAWHVSMRTMWAAPASARWIGFRASGPFALRTNTNNLPPINDDADMIGSAVEEKDGRWVFS
ncbi:MAG: hypothetical protein NBV68_13730 [Erythrobacter sp.]|nr:hypothetical protein [Erythrobacter sp.]